MVTSLCTLLTVVLRTPAFHPIHAARVELTSTAAGAVSAVMHVYRDDFPPGTDLGAINTYLDRTVTLTDSRHARVPLRATSVEPEGDRLRIVLASPVKGTLHAGSLQVAILQDRYPDQVNVVDARLASGRAQLLFLRGDGPQALP